MNTNKSNGQSQPQACPYNAHKAGECTCTPSITTEDVSASAAQVRASNDKLHASPEWQAAQDRIKQNQADLREAEESETVDDETVLVIRCKKCDKTEKVLSTGSETQLLSELCGKCYRDAFTKAHMEKPVKCEG